MLRRPTTLLVATLVTSAFALVGVTTPAYGEGAPAPATSPPAVTAAPFTGGWMESTNGSGTSYTSVYDITARPNNGGVVVTYKMSANSGGIIIFSLGQGQALTTGVEYSRAGGDGIDMGTCPAGSFEFDALGQPGANGTFSPFGVEFSAVCDGSLITGEMALDLPNDGGQGYYLYQQDGALYGFGNDRYLTYLGNLAALTLDGPVVAMATTPDGGGYWMVGSDGGIFAYGDAQFYGSMGGKPLNQPIVGIAATPTGKGYWEVAADGGIFAFGTAAFYGSMGGKPLNQPIVGIAATPTGKGYWEVATDGGIFAFGNAAFYGSTGGMTLNKPIVGMAPTPGGGGYWLVAADGGIFAYGDAQFYGSTGNLTLNEPIEGMVPTPDGEGYWFVASDGGVFAFGDAPFYGSLAGTATPTAPAIAGIAHT